MEDKKVIKDYNKYIQKNKQNVYELSNFKSKKRNLQGETVNICILETSPFIYKNSNGELKGIEADILNHFIKKSKIKPNITYFDSKSQENMDFSKTIIDLSNGKYDILCGNWTIREKRDELVNYSMPLYRTRASVFYEKENKLSNNYFFLILKIIFEFLLLILIIAVIIAFFHQQTADYKITYGESLWRTVASFAGEPSFAVHPDKFNSKINNINKYSLIIRFIIILLSTLLGVYLISVITSERVIELSENLKFQKMDELKNSTIAVIADTFEHDYLKELNKKERYNINIIAAEEEYSGKSISDFYDKNKKSMKIDGFLIGTELFYYQMGDISNKYAAGKLKIEGALCTFLFNKDDPQILEDFNKSFYDMYLNDHLTQYCKNNFTTSDDKCII